MENGEPPRYPAYSPNNLEYTPWASGNGHDTTNPMGWTADASLGSFESTPTILGPASGEAGWQNYGIDPSTNYWAPEATGFGLYESALQPSPAAQFSEYPWSPGDQPLPSPLSEAPSYVLTSRSGSIDWSNGGSFTPPALQQQPQQTSTSRSSSPADTTTQALSLAPPKHEQKRKRKATDVTSPTKRPTSATNNNKPKPKPKPKQKPKPPSSNSVSPSASNSSNATTAVPQTCTLGGVLPAHMDPRAASEQIKREAWRRCRAETHELSQRRLLLRDHESGALDREMKRLQMNLGLMRRAAAAAAAAAEGDSGGSEEGEGDGD